MPTIFTKIINREIPAEIVYETNDLIAIKDINPQALTHILIIPKKEIATINDLQNEDREVLADLFFAAKKIAIDLWIEEGYKLQFNVWEKWGQEVFHIHLHLLSNI